MVAIMRGVYAGVFCLLALLVVAAFVDSRADAADRFPVRRCINLGNAMEAPSEGDWGYRIRRADLVKIAEAGFDTIRLPVAFSAHTERRRPYTIDPALLARVDEVLAWAAAAKLGVILDLHHYTEMRDNPGRQIPRLAAIWRQLATRYRTQPSSVVFEIMNEPQGPFMNAAMAERVQAVALAEIRATNPKRWVMVSPPNYGTVSGLPGYAPPADRRTVVSISFYEPMNFTHQNAPFNAYPVEFGRAWGAPEDIAFVRMRAQQAMDWALDKRTPLFVGEFGVYVGNDVTQRAAWSHTVRQTFEGGGIGWCAWDFAGSFASYDLRKNAWLAPMKKALMK